MPKFAANLSHLWSELPYLDRFDAAKAAGFDGVEVLFPYDVAAVETRRALIRNDLRMVLINAPPPNYTGGARGFAADPEQRDRFRSDLRRALRYCEVLRVPMLHVMTGSGSGTDSRRVLVDNLSWAIETAAGRVTLSLEPLNATSMPGYFLNDYALAADIIDEVGGTGLRLQFDSFHAQMIHGDAVKTFETYAPLIGHVQIGDAPSRTPPGTGDVNFDALLSAIAASGFDGWISAEYTPPKRTGDALDWLPRFRDAFMQSN